MTKNPTEWLQDESQLSTSVQQGTKKCSGCGEAKPVDHFHPRSDGKGLRSKCKPCDRVDGRRRWNERKRDTNPARPQLRGLAPPHERDSTRFNWALVSQNRLDIGGSSCHA